MTVMGEPMADLFVIVWWIVVCVWCSFMSYRTGRDIGYDQGFSDGRDDASTSWERAIEKRGLTLKDDRG